MLPCTCSLLQPSTEQFLELVEFVEFVELVEYLEQKIPLAGCRQISVCALWVICNLHYTSPVWVKEGLQGDAGFETPGKARQQPSAEQCYRGIWSRTLDFDGSADPEWKKNCDRQIQLQCKGLQTVEPGASKGQTPMCKTALTVQKLPIQSFKHFLHDICPPTHATYPTLMQKKQS